MIGAKYIYSNLNTYFASYLYCEGEKNIEPKHTYFLCPALDILLYSFFTIGVKIGDKIGPRYSVLITLIIQAISYILLIFHKTLVILILSIAIFGIGGAISNLITIKNSWKYFPDSQGLVNGIIVAGSGITSFILTPLADYYIINPEKEDVDDNGFYPCYIAQRLETYLKVIVVIFAAFGILALIFTFDYEEGENKTKKNIKQKDDFHISSNMNILKEKVLDINDNIDFARSASVTGSGILPSFDVIDEKSDMSNKNANQRLCYAFFSLKNLMMLSFCFCGFFLDFLITNCNRDFANKNNVNQDALFLLGILFGLFNGLSRLFFGWLMDLFGFKIIMFFVSIVEFAIGCSIYFLVSNDIIYVILILLVGVCLGGSFAMMAPLFKKIFGIQTGPEVFGISGIALGLANLAGPILTTFVIEKNKDYLVAFLTGVFLVIVKLFALLFFNENKEFDYKLPDKNKGKKEKTDVEVEIAG